MLSLRSGAAWPIGQGTVISNLMGFTSAGSNPVVGTSAHKQTASSALHPSEVDK